MRGTGPRSAGDLLAELFRRKGMRRPMKRAEVVLLWPRVVGRDVAAFSAARAFVDGVLMVDVTDSETAMHLSMQRRRFLAVYHDTYGLKEVKDIRFHAGRVTSPSDETPGVATAPEPPPAEVRPLERAVDGAALPEDVKVVARAAARSLASHWARQRAAGHRECPTCGALHDGLDSAPSPRERRLAELGRDDAALRDRELCPSCRRAAREPRVIAASRSIALSPGAVQQLLSDDEYAVSTRMARLYLERAVNDLLPRAVSDTALRPQLEHVARCLAALLAEKAVSEVEDADMRLLDERVSRFLGGSWS